MGIVTKRVNEFPTPYTCRNAIQKGGPETKLSMILMGLGNFVHGQKIKGLLYLAVEVAYIVFMAVNGITFLSMLGGLGSVPQKEVWDEASQVYLYTKGDQSILILLYGVATILVSVLMVFAWRGALQSAYKAECLAKEGKHVNTFGEDLKSAQTSDDTTDDFYFRIYNSAADLHDLYGIYELQQDRQSSDAV